MEVQVKETTEVPLIDEALDKFARGDASDLDALLKEIEINVEIHGTKVTSHFYMLAMDAHGRPRMRDLVRHVCARVVEYSIPRSRIEEARKRDAQTKTGTQYMLLRAEAVQLFTSLLNTGEGGELLLYIFAEEFLQLPQILTKMSLKTSSKMHFHGADGLYAGVNTHDQNLCLYWGESKVHAKFTQAVDDCLESLGRFLKGVDEKGNLVGSRDLQLLYNFIDLDDSSLEEAFKKFLDPQNDQSNHLEMRGVALVGFNDESYPDGPNKKKFEEVQKEIAAKIDGWKQKIKRQAEKEKIESFIFHFFVVPLTLVKDFRKIFLEELGVKMSKTAPRAKPHDSK